MSSISTLFFITLLLRVSFSFKIAPNVAYVHGQFSESEDPACDSERKQQITFHEFQDFTGQFQTFCSNQPDIQNTPGFAKSALYVCINRGVWVLGVEFNGIESGGTLVSGNFGRICIWWGENMKVKYTSVRHLAASSMDHSAISFFERTSTGLNWRGPELFLDGNEMRLQEPISGISSYGLTGSESYTIYSGINFNGQTECLAPGQNNPFLNGVSFHSEIGLQTIGSIRKGCSSEVRPNKEPSSEGDFVRVDGRDLSGLQVKRF